MRCLVLSPFVPFPPVDGGRTRTFELARGLVAARFEVELLALGPGSADGLHDAGIAATVVEHRAGTLSTLARAVGGGRSLYGQRYRSAALAAELRSRLAGGGYDVVQCEFAYMAQYRDAAPGGPLWVLDEHNVEFRLNESIAAAGGSLAYRAYARRELPLRKREELAGCAAADHVFTTSEDDREVLARELPGLQATVVPNGVDLERFARAGGGAVRSGAVFVGKMDYRPNVDAAVWFCDEVLPRVRSQDPAFAFTIVGAEPAPAVRALEKHDGVEVTGFVDDTRPYLESAAVAVVPLRSGSGTRLKILEALAMQTPVVSTTTGAEGIEALGGEHLWREDDPAGFADRVLAVARGGDAVDAVARAGRELVERRYGWKAIGASAAETVAALVAERREATAAAPA